MKSTEENNKLIAEFMEFPKVPREHELKFSYGIKGFAKLGLSETTPSGLRFHSDWNWLMGVVQKVESFSGNKDVINWSRNNWSIFDLKLSSSKIETVYNAVVSFIEWYNEQKKV